METINYMLLGKWDKIDKNELYLNITVPICLAILGLISIAIFLPLTLLFVASII